MAQASDTVWLPVLPSMRDFGPALIRGAGAEVDRAGGTVGKRFGKALVAGTAAVAAAGVATVGALYKVGEVFSDMSTSISVATGASGADLDKLVDTAKRVSTNVPASFEEVSAAVSSVQSSLGGFSNMTEAEFDKATENALNFSKAFEVDTDRVTQVVGQMLKTGLVGDANEAFDLLVAASQKVPAALREDLLDAMDEYGPFFSQLGISGEEAMNALASASDKGVFGIDKTGDALKEFTIRATDMSDASAVAFEALGLSQEEMSAALLAGGDVGAEAFQKIIGGLQDMTDPVAQSQAALALFGTPLEDLGTGSIPQFIDALSGAESVLGEVDGAAGRMGDSLNSGPKAAFEMMKNELMVGLAPAAEWVFTRLGTLMSEVAGGVKAFGAAWQANDGDITSSGFPGFMEGLAYAARQAFDYFQTIVMPVLRQFGSYIMETVVPALKSFGSWLKDNANILGIVAAGIVTYVAVTKTMAVVGAITKVVKGMTLAQLSLNAAFKANPIGFVVTALTLLAAGVMYAYNNIGWFRDAVDAAFRGVREIVGSVAEWFQSTALPILSAVWGAISSGAMWLYENAIRPAWSGIQSAVQAVATWFQTTLLPAITTVFDAVGSVFSWLYENIVKPVFDLIVWYIGAWWTIVSGIFQVAVALVRNYLAPIFVWLYESVIKPVFGWVASAISLWWEGAKIIFGAVVGFFQNTLGPIFVWLYENIIKPVFGFIGTVVSLWWAGAQLVFGAVVGFLRNTLGPAFTWLRDSIISPVFDGIRFIISSIWENGIRPVFSALSDFVQNKIPAAFNAAKDGIGTAWDKIQEIAKKPVRFVIDRVINDGLIGTFNKIPGVDIKKISLPPGFKNGGYTGDGPADEIAGPAHRGEFYFTKKQTAAIGKEKLYAMARNAGRGAAATAGEGNMGGFFHGSAAAIRRAGAYFLNVPASMAAWNFAGAARMWDGAASVRVGVGRGQAQGYASSRERGGGILGYTVGNNIDMSPSWMARLGATQRRTVAAHEMGHALGLPHNSRNSIMQPNLANMASSPTAVDIRNLQALYPGGSGRAGSGVAENPFDGIVGRLVGQFKKQYPEGGMIIDSISGLVKSAIEKVTKWIQDIKDGISNVAGDVVDKVRGFFGGGAAVTDASPMAYLHDQGGVLQPGLSAILNKTGKPEAILNAQQWGDISKLALSDRNPTREIVIQGNVGWDPAEVARQIETQERRARVIEGVFA